MTATPVTVCSPRTCASSTSPQTPSACTGSWNTTIEHHREVQPFHRPLPPKQTTNTTLLFYPFWPQTERKCSGKALKLQLCNLHLLLQTKDHHLRYILLQLSGMHRKNINLVTSTLVPQERTTSLLSGSEKPYEQAKVLI